MPGCVPAYRNWFDSLSGLYIAKVGDVRVKWSRPLPSEPSPVTVIKDPGGRYYASFVVERKPSPLPPCERETGIDVGLDPLAATSDGEIIANPRFLRAKQRHLARAQRAVCRAAGRVDRLSACGGQMRPASVLTPAGETGILRGAA
jgi:transposase